MLYRQCLIGSFSLRQVGFSEFVVGLNFSGKREKQYKSKMKFYLIVRTKRQDVSVSKWSVILLLIPLIHNMSCLLWCLLGRIDGDMEKFVRSPVMRVGVIAELSLVNSLKGKS